jgi:hypothetical protein
MGETFNRGLDPRSIWVRHARGRVAGALENIVQI